MTKLTDVKSKDSEWGSVEDNVTSNYVSIYGNTKALYHEDKIKDLHENKSIAPTMIQVDLEAFCNDNCSFCTTRKDNGFNNDMLELLQIRSVKKISDYQPIGRPSEDSRLPLDMSQKLPQMMKDAKISAITLTGGGEPTLWPKFDELILNLAKNNIEIGLITNGSNLSKRRIKILAKHCTWIRFSMDASNPQIHRKIHRTPGIDFERRVSAIQELLNQQNNESPLIGVTFVITPENFFDIENSCIFYRNLGVKYIRFSWMYDKDGNAGFSDERIAIIKQVLKKSQKKYETSEFSIKVPEDRIDMYSRPNDDFQTCYYQRFVWAIGANGSVYPCCIQKYVSGYEIGSIKENTLKQLIINQFTTNKMNNLNPLNCAPCWMREKNKTIAKGVELPEIIEKIKNGPRETVPIHINFV